MTVHQEIGATLAPCHDVSHVIEGGCLIARIRHGDVVEGDDLVIGMPEVGNFMPFRSDGEHAREVVAHVACFVDVAHGGKKVATDGCGGSRCSHGSDYARTEPDCDVTLAGECGGFVGDCGSDAVGTITREFAGVVHVPKLVATLGAEREVVVIKHDERAAVITRGAVFDDVDAHKDNDDSGV